MRLRADGGKYAPASAWTVLQHNRRARSPADKIPMRGLIIGDGWCDPETQTPAYTDMLWGMGLLDTAGRAQVEAALKRSTDALAAGELVGAFDGWNSLWGDYWSDYPGRTNFGPTLFTNLTGGTDTENVWCVATHDAPS